MHIRHFHTTLTVLKVVPKNLKGKSKSSQEWLMRQLNDPYVKKAQELNYRARSALKLLEMDEKVKILKPGMTVVECGAAPGAWTQVIISKINSDGRNPKKPIGRVIAIDLLPIEPLPGAVLLPGCDFTSPDTFLQIVNILSPFSDSNNSALRGPNPLVDIILSDMAPNATGTKATDHPRIITLVRKVISFAIDYGKVGSHLLAKVWDGNEIESLEKELETVYHKVNRLKPPSSRNDSAEIFLIARNKKN